MAKLMDIEVVCDRKGNLTARYVNLVGLTRNSQNDATAFSAAALLANQLSLLPVRTGRELCTVAYRFCKHIDADPVSIGTFLTKYHSKLSLDEVPASFDLDLAAKVTLLGDSSMVRAIVKPKMGLLARFQVERMSMMVANYIRHVLNLDLGAYTNMVPASIVYVTEMYSEFPDISIQTAIGNNFIKELGAYMDTVSRNLYMVWQTDINNNS